MRILIATGLFPPDIGGPATMIEALVMSLRQKKFNVKVVTYSRQVRKVSKIEDVNIQVYLIPLNKFFIIRHLVYFYYLWKLSNWADLLYVTDTYSVGYFAYLIKKIRKKKYVLRFAGDSAWEIAFSNRWTTDYIVDFENKYYNSKIEKLKRRRQQIMLEADKIIAVSYFLANIASQIGVPQEKIEIIYNAIDFFDYKDNPVEMDQIKKRFGSKGKIIVTACRLTSWKGVDRIIKIMPQIRKQVGEVNLLVLGDGPELYNLKKPAVELKASYNVYFLGRIDHSKIMNYFKAADLFILNSYYEGFSHTLLEAMVAGVPIITTNAGGNIELIEHEREGILVDYNNPQLLLDAAVRILQDPQLAQDLAIKANKKVSQFSWLKTVEKTVSVLREVYDKQ